ncbi:hypothetical protein Tco_1468173 [Tanacetum coccineum]
MVVGLLPSGLDLNDVQSLLEPVGLRDDVPLSLKNEMPLQGLMSGGRIAWLMEKMGGVSCIFWDINVIRRCDDRLNSQINVREMNDFNEFINDARLVEVPIGVLKDIEMDFGPKPFRFFDVWLEEMDIEQIVENAWKKSTRSRRPDCMFKDKLKNVKDEIRK